MSGIPRTVEDILKSGTRRALPRQVDYPDVDVASYVQGVDNFHKVFAIRPGDHVVYLCDPLIDPRVGQAIYGLSKARGATFASYMGASTQLTRAPEEARALIERADFVVSTWFASVVDPFFIGLRRDKGQRWIKITFFRNLDLLKTPHARFPVDLLGEIIRATSRLYPESGEFDLRFSDPRGTDFKVRFDQEMKHKMLSGNRWRGHNIADEDGCYIHYLPTHGPNLYERTTVDNDEDIDVDLNGIVYPQWAVGFDKPFEEPPGIEFENDRVVRVHGDSEEAGILREMLIGGRLHELGCGFNPKAPRFDIYPQDRIPRVGCISGSTRLSLPTTSSVSCRTGKSRTSTWTWCPSMQRLQRATRPLSMMVCLSLSGIQTSLLPRRNTAGRQTFSSLSRSDTGTGGSVRGG